MPVPAERDKATILENEIAVIIKIPLFPNKRKLATIMKKKNPTSSQVTCLRKPSRIDVRLPT